MRLFYQKFVIIKRKLKIGAILKKLVSFITSSIPDKNFTTDLILSLKESGSDAIELGIPFSDPVADGPVIEKADQIALANGFKVDDIFDISKKVAGEIDTYLMGYFNSFYKRGFEKVTNQSKEIGLKGFIIPDLPFEEAREYNSLVDDSFALVNFIAPTHPKERIDLISKDAKGFIYLVAYAGITGSGQSEDLSKIISNVKERTKTPLYIGFGVNEKTAKEKAKGVDGVIVGSAFVNILIDESLTNSQKIDKISNLSRVIKDKINS